MATATNRNATATATATAKAKAKAKAKARVSLADKRKAEARKLIKLAGKRRLAKAPDGYSDSAAQLDRTYVVSYIDTYIGRRIGEAFGANKQTVTPKLLALALDNRNARKLVLDAIDKHDAATKARHESRDTKPETIKAHAASVAAAREAVDQGGLHKLAECIGRLSTSGYVDYSIKRLGSDEGVPDSLIGYCCGIVSPAMTRTQRANADIVAA